MKETVKTSCPDCGVAQGKHHTEGCDIARCSKCGEQRLSCDCKGGKTDVWTGQMMPEEHRICEEQNLWCRDIAVYSGHEFVMDSNAMSQLCHWLHVNQSPGFRIRFHIPCEKTDPGAHPDLNRAAVFRITGKK